MCFMHINILWKGVATAYQYIMSLDFPFLISSALEDVASILRYINVSILFYSILFYGHRNLSLVED